MAKKEWKKTKTIYWKDELNDDFDEVGLKRPPVPENFHYIRSNKFANFFYAIIYHGIAKPILGTYCLFAGIRWKNKKYLKELKGQGAYFYANHTAITDVFKLQSFVFFFGRRINILGYSDTLSMPKFVYKLAWIVGYLPIPLKGDLKNLVALTDACNYYINKKQYVLIYPEAHIWPYYTKIREFTAASFTYPSRSNTPIVPIVTTWRKPLIGKKPKQTIYFCHPIFPKEGDTAANNKQYLRDQCLKAMKEVSEKIPQYEYIKYIKVESDDKKED